MNPLPLHGTKYLGGAIALIGLITGEWHDAIMSFLGSIGAQKWGVAGTFVLSGILVTLRGFQNSANQTAQAAKPSSSTTQTFVFWLVAPVFAFMVAAQYGCASTSFLSTAQKISELNVTMVNTTDALLKAQSISVSDATTILSIADKVDAALTVANTAYQAGNAGSANATVANLTTALLAVNTCLTQPAALATCLQGIAVSQ